MFKCCSSKNKSPKVKPTIIRVGRTGEPRVCCYCGTVNHIKRQVNEVWVNDYYVSRFDNELKSFECEQCSKQVYQYKCKKCFEITLSPHSSVIDISNCVYCDHDVYDIHLNSKLIHKKDYMSRSHESTQSSSTVETPTSVNVHFFD